MSASDIEKLKQEVQRLKLLKEIEKIKAPAQGQEKSPVELELLELRRLIELKTLKKTLIEIDAPEQAHADSLDLLVREIQEHKLKQELQQLKGIKEKAPPIPQGRLWALLLSVLFLAGYISDKIK